LIALKIGKVMETEMNQITIPCEIMMEEIAVEKLVSITVTLMFEILHVGQ